MLAGEIFKRESLLGKNTHFDEAKLQGSHMNQK